MTDHQDCEAKMASLKQAVDYLEQQLAACKKGRAQEDSRKQEFVTLVAHDLRTPIAIIKECVSQLQDRLSGDVSEEQEKLLSLAMLNIERLNGCINQYVDRLRLGRKDEGRSAG